MWTILLLVNAIMYGFFDALWNKAVDNPLDAKFAQFWHNRFSLHGPDIYPPEFFGNVQPISCHSHNDYSRRTPLFAALGAGCISVEADVWLKEGDLYVGHKRSGLDKNTLRNMYIDPLTRILTEINSRRLSGQNLSKPLGVFYKAPSQGLILLVDFKTPSAEAWTVFLEQLEPLREQGWLTHWNGKMRINRPIIVVASGAVDFNVLVANHTYRDVFYDAPLDALEDCDDKTPDTKADRKPLFNDLATKRNECFTYNSSNSHLASAKLSKAIELFMFSNPSKEQLERLHRQIHSAQERDLISRYWGIPNWPRGLRNRTWKLLVGEEVGLLNVDDLEAMGQAG